MYQAGAIVDELHASLRVSGVGEPGLAPGSRLQQSTQPAAIQSAGRLSSGFRLSISSLNLADR